MKKRLCTLILCVARLCLAQEAAKNRDSAAYRPDAAMAGIPGYRLVWNDEFSRDGAPDSEKWRFEKGFCRNRELQWYQKENAVCKGGLLVIEGRKERVKNPNYDPKSSDWKKRREYAEYTSSSLNTWGKTSWKLSEAVIVARARLTPDAGYFPAIWTTGPGQWPHGGEVDLMECYGGRILGNFAWGTRAQWQAKWHPYDNPNHKDANKPRITYFTDRDHDWLKKFHVWKLVGSETKTQILLDGEIINEVSHDTAKNPQTQWSKVVHPFKESHSLILNLAIGAMGGDPAGGKLPLIYEVDYARVYQKQ